MQESKLDSYQKDLMNKMVDMRYRRHMPIYPLRNRGYRTPFEQAAYDIQFRPKNRVSGPDLGSSLTPNINETSLDRDILVAIVCLVAFIVLLILV